MSNPIPIPKHSPWITQFLVIRALFEREVATRFGKYRLGLFWMLFEPLLGVLVIGLLIGGLVGRAVPEIPYAFFLLNGFLPLRLFTGPLGTGVNAISSNQGLLVYASVRPLDPLLARFLFELVTTMFSFVVFCVAGMWLGIDLSLEEMEVILAAYLLVWLCGCGFGLLFGVMAVYYREVEKVVMVIQRPMLFASAVLYPTSAVPEGARKYLFLNPVTHVIEVSRHALFPHYSAEGANLLYPLAFAIVILALGMAVFHNNRNYLSTQV